jgi:hypothetical protein
MKQSMQVIAMVAFLGCFAVLVIAAGSGKAKSQENCSEEWKKGIQHEKKTVQSDAVIPTGCMATCSPENKQEVAFPVELFHAVL